MATAEYSYIIIHSIPGRYAKLVYLLMSILPLIICIYCIVLNDSTGLLSRNVKPNAKVLREKVIVFIDIK